MKKILIISVIAFVIGAAAGMLLSRHCPVFRPQSELVVQTDTLTIRDTIVENRPVFVESIRTDTLLIAIRDTVKVLDTMYVVISREQKHYIGDDYEAWVSGYRPVLDSIYVFPETRYITEEISPTAEPKRWGIGVQVGYGMSLPQGKPEIAPYIGIGISYNLIRF